MTSVNLNQYVSYELTEAGVKQFHILALEEKSEFSLDKPRIIEELTNSDGLVEMALHDFAFFWGRSLYVGAPNYIKDTTIIIKPLK